MVAEPIRYVIACSCHTEQPVAYIDDLRPGGGPITVSAATPEDQQIISASGYHPERERDAWRPPDGYVESKWADRNVTVTVWDWKNSRSGYTIRCLHCNQQAQFPGAELPRIADKLAENRKPEALLPPSPGPVTADDLTGAYDDDGWFIPDPAPPAVVFQRRYFVQLAALVREVQ